MSELKLCTICVLPEIHETIAFDDNIVNYYENDFKNVK